MSRFVVLVTCLALALPLGWPVLAHDGHGAPVSKSVSPAAPANALTITDAFTRATRPGAPVAGGFMTISNTTSHDDRLVGASSAVAGVVQIHEMVMEGDVMRMRELPHGLPIPAGQAVALKPGGYHVMLMDLKAPLVEGTTVDVALTFETAGTVTVPLAVLGPNAEGFPGKGQ